MFSGDVAGGEELRRATALVVVAALLVSSLSVGSIVAAAGNTAGNSTTPDDPDTYRYVYVNDSDSQIALVYGNGTEVGLSDSAEILGAARDLDGDAAVEVPYVTSQNELYALDVNGEKQHLASNARKDKTKLATADWDDDGRAAVFYAGTDGMLYRVEVGGNATVFGDGIAAQSPLGVADLTDDGVEELVYTDGSNLYYTNRSGTVKFYDGGVGSNVGLGVGAPADFDLDGTPRVPIVTGSEQAALVSANGSVTTLGNSAKVPVAAGNWTGDARLELFHVADSATSDVKYVTLDGSTGNAASSSAKDSAGVARAVEDEELNVSNFTLTNTTDTLTVSFETNDKLDRTTVELSGPENATFHLSDFSVSGSGDGPFTYSVTYDPTTAGEYEATFHTATDRDGDVFDRNLRDTAVVTEGGVVVTNATLVDLTDRNGVVNESDRVRVTAEVYGDVNQVQADLSAFGAGTQTLDHVSGNIYATNASVDVTGVSADNRTATVTANDGEGNTDSDTTNSLLVDTVAPQVTNANRTVQVDTTASYSPDSYSDGTWVTAFDWAFGNGDTASGESVSYTYSQIGTYTAHVAVTDAAGNVGTETFTVTVEPKPHVNATLLDATNDDGAVNESHRIRIVANVSGDVESVTADASAFGHSSVTLSAVDGDTYATTLAVDAANVTATNETVTVTAHDGEGHTASDVSNALLLDTVAPRVDLGGAYDVTEDETVTFSPETLDEDGGVTRFFWTFGTGANATGETVTYSYDDPGTYTVRLSVTDEAGNVRVDSVSVDVDQQTTADTTDTTDSTDSTNTTDSTDTNTTDSTDTNTTTTTTTDDGGDTQQTTTTTTTTTTTQAGGAKVHTGGGLPLPEGPLGGLLWILLLIVLLGLAARLTQKRLQS